MKLILVLIAVISLGGCEAKLSASTSPRPKTFYPNAVVGEICYDGVVYLLYNGITPKVNAHNTPYTCVNEPETKESVQ